ncbi:hypothetical protein [Haladaptatus sp. NG-WS-4]
MDTEIPGFGGTRTENFIASADDGSLTHLYLLPPLFLLGAGFAVAYLSGIETPNAGGVVGTLVVVGYLPLAVAGAFAFGYGIGDGTIAPDVVTAVLLAGVVYPAVFGGLGGMGGKAVATRS